jgi:hypothetical protein
MEALGGLAIEPADRHSADGVFSDLAFDRQLLA